jgi:membrane protein
VRFQAAYTLLRRSVRAFLDDRALDMAAAISFRVLFSLAPLVIFLVAAVGAVISWVGVRADIVAAAPLSEDGREDLRKLLDGASRSAAGPGLVGLVALVWTASGMMAAIRSALNVIWKSDQSRHLAMKKVVDVLLVLATAALVLLSLALSISSRMVARYAGTWLEEIGIGEALLTTVATAIMPLVLLVVAVGFLYRVAPAVRPPWRSLWPVFPVAAALVALQAAFAVYVEHFANYNAVYGSLGAVIAFLTFVYLATIVFLFGAEVAATAASPQV